MVTTGACPSDIQVRKWLVVALQVIEVSMLRQKEFLMSWQIEALVSWARQNKLGLNTLYSTSSLAEAGFLGATSLDNCICGVTIATISDTDCLLWFRKRKDNGQVMAWADPLVCGSPVPASQPTPHPKQQSLPFTAGEVSRVEEELGGRQGGEGE